MTKFLINGKKIKIKKRNTVSERGKEMCAEHVAAHPVTDFNNGIPTLRACRESTYHINMQTRKMCRPFLMNVCIEMKLLLTI